jgi:hypothetical protein
VVGAVWVVADGGHLGQADAGGTEDDDERDVPALHEPREEVTEDEPRIGGIRCQE